MIETQIEIKRRQIRLLEIEIEILEEQRRESFMWAMEHTFGPKAITRAKEFVRGLIR